MFVLDELRNGSVFVSLRNRMTKQEEFFFKERNRKIKFIRTRIVDEVFERDLKTDIYI